VIIAFVLSLLLILATVIRINCLKSEVSKKKTVKVTVISLFILYSLYLLWLLFLDAYSGRAVRATMWSQDASYASKLTAYIQASTNFVPFATIGYYIAKLLDPQLWRSSIVNLLGNLAAFSAMGFFLPALFSKLRRLRIFLPCMLVGLILVETAQMFSFTGSCDVDDIIENFIGALTVFAVLRIGFIKRLFARCLIDL
jgi:glycopeptide antibiotics resistance protein